MHKSITNSAHGIGRAAVYALLEARIIPSLRLKTRYLIGRHAYEEWDKTIGAKGGLA